jgi:Bacterial PH domain
MNVMRCPACGMRCDQRANFCGHCGARLEVSLETNPPGGIDGRAADDENELWSGGYSWRGGYREWLVALLIGIVLSVVRMQNPELLTLPRFFGAIAIVVLMVAALVTYRTINERFILTDQRLIHRQGFFFWRTDRIELIDIDDLRFEDNVLERILDVGNIVVISSDKSHPKLVLRGIAQAGKVYDLLETVRRDERLRRGLFVESI